MGPLSGVLELLIFKIFWPFRPNRDTKLSLNPQCGPFSVKMLPPPVIKLKMLERLDLSHDFWDRFGVQNKSLKKQVGLYEIENINNANVLTIAINPKEYFEKYKDFSVNKKHKGMKKIPQE